MRRAAAAVCLLLVSHVGVAQDADSPTVAAPKAEVVAVPLSDVPERSHQVSARLRSIVERLRPSSAIEEIEASLARLSAEQAAASGRAQEILRALPDENTLADLESAWRAREFQLSAPVATLRARSTAIRSELRGLESLTEQWNLTRERAAADAAVPQSIRARIAEILAAIAEAAATGNARQSRVLDLQERVGSLVADAGTVLTDIKRARAAFMSRLLERDGPPVWQWFSPRDQGEAIGEQFRGELVRQGTAIADYLAARPVGVGLHVALTLLAAFVLVRGRARARKWAEDEPRLARVTQVFAVPFSMALLLSLASITWVAPFAPVPLKELAGLVAFLPAIRLLQRLCPPELFAGLYAMGAFYVVDRVRLFLAVSTTISSVVFAVEMAAAVGVTFFVLSEERVAKLGWPQADTRSRYVLGLRWAVVALLVVALVATLLGYGQLGRLLGDGALNSGYAALLLFATVQAADGLWAYLLRSRMAGRVHFVGNHRWVFQRRGRKAITFAAIAMWAMITLAVFALLDPISAWVESALTTQFSRGNLNLSLADVLVFGLSVWGAFLLSRFIRFVLDEDVYPRIRLAHGVPYALSTLLHYGLVIGGFLFAIAAIGFDTSRFAIVVGALGVGIGFGLQNVVNNFASGLILLFERPVQVGDAVEVGSLSGEVRRIGIRSSTIRSWDGADVIVPNGSLISDTVTNWTLTDRMKRIEIDVGVAYGNDPQVVIDLLKGVVDAHEEIVKTPKPAVLFIGFGDSSLDFRVRGWTAQFDRWVTLRSEMMVDIAHAIRDAGIEIPFPQRDLHVRSVDPSVTRVIVDPGEVSS